MRLLVIYLIIFIMNLSKSLHHLRSIEPSFNRRETLVKKLTLAKKIASNSERTNFLMQCRRANIIPRFIQNIVKRTDLVSTRSAHFLAQKRRFCREMLNEAIKESYRRKAFLTREKRRLYEAQPTSSPDVVRWVDEEAARSFLSCVRQNRKNSGEEVPWPIKRTHTPTSS